MIKVKWLGIKKTMKITSVYSEPHFNQRKTPIGEKEKKKSTLNTRKCHQVTKGSGKRRKDDFKTTVEWHSINLCHQ